MVVNGALDRGEFERAFDPKRLGYTNAAGRVSYTESHDEERVMSELAHAGYGADETMRRAITLLALTLTAPGPAMVYSGQEFGEDTKKIVGPNPLHWMKLKKSGNQRMMEKTGDLLRLRDSNPALLSEDQQIRWDGLPENVVVCQRTGGQDAVVIAANLGKKKQAVSIPLPAAGAWVDILNGGAVRVLPTAGLATTIDAGGVVVLALKPESQLTLAKP
jgi:1,4-alpha-glucan branching enzyme